MSTIKHTDLACELLRYCLNDPRLLNAGSDELIGLGEDPGVLDLAAIYLDGGNLFDALQHLDAAEQICREPVETPTKGRNRLERHLQATRTRARLLSLTQIARVLVLDALKSRPLITPEG